MKRIVVFFILVAALPILTGCNVFRRTPQRPATALPASGIFQSIDGGQTWRQTSSLYITEGEPQKMAYSLLYAFRADPNDPKAVYAATDRGIYYSYNWGVGWFLTLSGKGPVNDVAIHPQDPCTLYALVRNEVYKSIDCSRNWTRKHFSSLRNEFFTALFISRSDPDRVFVGTSEGAVLQSFNAGESWEVKEYLESPVRRFFEHAYDDDSFFFVTEKGMLYRTRDNAETWELLNDLPVQTFNGEPVLTKRDEPARLRDLSRTNQFLDLQFDGSQEDGLIYSSQYGIFRLINGEYWQEIEILNKPREQSVYSVAIDTTTGQTVYFAAAQGFYRSETGGKDWTISKLPSSGKPKFIVVASDNPKQVMASFEAWPSS